MTRRRRYSPAVRQWVGTVVSGLVGIWPPRDAKRYLRDLGFNPETLASLIVSELSAPPSDPPPPVDGDAVCQCGHTRREHCGCGADCFATFQTDPPTYPSDEEIDTLTYLWRSMSDLKLSKALSDIAAIPKEKRCGCAGFVAREAA